MLEAKIEQLEKTLLTLIEVISADTTLRREVVGKIETTVKAADAKAEKAAGRAITDSPEDRKPSAETPAADKKTEVQLPPEVELAASTASEFIGGATSEEDRAARKARVREMLTKLKAEGLKSLTPEQAAKVVKSLKAEMTKIEDARKAAEAAAAAKGAEDDDLL